MNTSEMKDRIVIQKNTPSTGAIINLDGNWVNFLTLWAKVEYLKGREYFQAQAVNSENTVKFIVRYRTDLQTDMRVIFMSRIFEINAVMPLDNNKKWLIIHAREVVFSD